MDQRVRMVIALMQDDLHREFPITEVAQVVHLSPSRLRQMFKADTGMSFAHYLKAMRMERAKKLLETTFLSVKEVMTKVGFRNECHFVRDFKRAYGWPPAQYRVRYNSGTRMSVAISYN